jgi:hypothetical protein
MLIAHFGVGLRWGWQTAMVGPSLGLLLSLFVANATLRMGLGWPATGGATVCFLLLLGLGCRLKPAPPVPPVPLARWELPLLALLALSVWAVTAVSQLDVIDDDYWLHTPVQRQIFDGQLPPSNPIAPDLVLQGHFMRDLLIAGWSRVSGTSLLRSQCLATCVCQYLALCLFFTFLRRGQDGPGQAWVSLAMLWFGFNALFVTGLADFYKNNGSLVYLHLALSFCLGRWLWDHSSAWTALLLGLVGGSLAQTYETHFGLFGLATAALVVAFRPHRRVLRTLAAAALLAVLVALCNGGVITSMVCNLRDPDPQHENQSQQVRLRFPKQKLLAMWIGEREIHPLSVVYREPPGSWILPLWDGPGARVDENYVPLWSWTVLRMHWLPLYLAPFTVVWLYRLRHVNGFWLGAFGMAAFLVPGLVDFGVNHEHEYLRWEVAAGVGLGGALGICLAQARGRLGLGVSGLLLASCVHIGLIRHAQSWERVSLQGVGRVLGVRVSLREWCLAHAAELRLNADDLDGMDFLASSCRPRERLLVNFQPDDPWGILFESTLLQATGLELVGHALPPPGSAVGSCPLPWSPAAARFFADPSPAHQDALRLDWLYLHRAPPSWYRRLEQHGTSPRAVFGEVRIYGLGSKHR